MCAPLLSKYELHPVDRLIHHMGKRGKREEDWRERERERERERARERERGDGTERGVSKVERGREREWEE